MDGDIHNRYDQAEYDKVRQKEIEGRNMKVLRFQNDQVIYDMETVLNTIRQELKEGKER